MSTPNIAALVAAGHLTEDAWTVKCSCGAGLTGSPDDVKSWTSSHDDSPECKHIVTWVEKPRPWALRYTAATP